VNLDAERGAIARAFQDAMIDTLVEKTTRAARQFGRGRVVLGGGVSCNATLVAAMRERFEPRGVQVFAPSARLATDNAAMIARAGLFHLERGEQSTLDLNAFATQAIPGFVAA
jgi:N6-L-threonylcarbamoyladenine synthase